MQRTVLNVIFIILVSLCYTIANITNASTTECRQCSPCWNIFNQNHAPCSTGELTMNPFNDVQPMCIDTLILLIIMFLGIVMFIPTCVWLFFLWIKRCRNTAGKYVVNGCIVD